MGNVRPRSPLSLRRPPVGGVPWIRCLSCPALNGRRRCAFAGRIRLLNGDRKCRTVAPNLPHNHRRTGGPSRNDPLDHHPDVCRGRPCYGNEHVALSKPDPQGCNVAQKDPCGPGSLGRNGNPRGSKSSIRNPQNRRGSNEKTLSRRGFGGPRAPPPRLPRRSRRARFGGSACQHAGLAQRLPAPPICGGRHCLRRPKCLCSSRHCCPHSSAHRRRHPSSTERYPEARDPQDEPGQMGATHHPHTLA